MGMGLAVIQLIDEYKPKTNEIPPVSTFNIEMKNSL